MKIIFLSQVAKLGVFNICLICLFRIIDQRFERVSYFVFGDFNFRLDAKSVVEVGSSPFFTSEDFHPKRLFKKCFQVGVQFALEITSIDND